MGEQTKSSNFRGQRYKPQGSTLNGRSQKVDAPSQAGIQNGTIKNIVRHQRNVRNKKL